MLILLQLIEVPLSNDPHEVEPLAIDDVALVSAPLKEARDWIDRHPEFNRNFLLYLGLQMRKLETLKKYAADACSQLQKKEKFGIPPGSPE